VLAERRVNARGQLIALSEATVKLDVAGRRAMEVGEGNGPVNALDAALRKALIPVYPELADMRLVDFKVRILDSAGGTAATTRVMIESADATGRRWSTIGVSPNIVDASYNALYDALTYKLFRDGAKAAHQG
jgi:2-isopropylmalate synthase